MKKAKKLLLTALTLVCAGTLATGTSILALADTEGEGTEGRVYNAKYDEMFEDFDRADISDTVTANTNVDLGEKPYLHVVYTAGVSTTPSDAIYKNGSGSLQYVSQGGTITIRMRAPEGGVSLSDLIFAVRSPSYDNDSMVVAKSFTELYNANLNEMPALTAGWQDYVISFSNTYESNDRYDNGTGSAVTNDDLAGIHIYATPAASGVLDIASVTYSTGGSESYLNNFIGGDEVGATAKEADSGYYWAGSSQGYIVKRAPVLSDGGQLDIVRAAATSGYAYAYITADGDTENLTVSTMTNGTDWSEAVAYTTVLAISDGVTGLRFAYSGAVSAAVCQIFLTNFEEDAVASAIPVIDAENTQKLEDFNVPQTGINGDYEEMSTAPQMTAAGLLYRLSYNNGDKVSVADGALVLDATSLAANDYINFKFASATYSGGDYIVLKVKAEDGATLDGLRFAIGSNDVYGDVIWSSAFMAGYGLPMAGLDGSNPYVTEDGWYYLVIDLEASGFNIVAAGYNGLDLYYSGTGVLKIDEIFFATEAEPYTQTIVVSDTEIDFTATEDGYQYAGCMYLPNSDGEYDVLALTITIAEGTNLSGVRLEFDTGMRWFGDNEAGSLYTTDGLLLSEVEFTAGEAKTVYIDLAASGLETFVQAYVHTNGTATGSFKMTDITLLQVTALSEAKIVDEYKTFTMTEENGEPTEIDFTATEDGYQYAGYMYLPNSDGEYDVLALTITIAEGTNLSGVRLEFDTGMRWFGDNEAGSLYTTDGLLLSEVEFTAGEAKTVYIDLAASGLETFVQAYVHTNGTATGSFKIENIQLLAYRNFYAEAIDALPVYGTPDYTAPSVSISTGTTATAGDTVTVSYTASDDVTAAEDLQITVTVKKDGAEVALTGNSFTVEEGVYTVTVTVRDEAGNESSDTIQITVSAKSSSDDPTTDDPATDDPSTDDPTADDPVTDDPSDDEPSNLTWLWIVLGVVAAAAVIAVVIVVVKKKKN